MPLRSSIFLSVTLLLCFGIQVGTTTPCTAETQTIATPVFGQIVALPVPIEFGPAFEQANEDAYILELAPKGESVEHWSQLITVTGYRGLSSTVGSTGFMQLFLDRLTSSCPNSFASETVDIGPMQGASDMKAAWLGCGMIGGHSENFALLVVNAGGNIYTIQWAERGAAQANAPDPDWAIWDPRFKILVQGRLCQRIDGEPAPYLSCSAN